MTGLRDRVARRDCDTTPRESSAEPRAGVSGEAPTRNVWRFEDLLESERCRQLASLPAVDGKRRSGGGGGGGGRLLCIPSQSAAPDESSLTFDTRSRSQSSEMSRHRHTNGLHCTAGITLGVAMPPKVVGPEKNSDFIFGKPYLATIYFIIYFFKNSDQIVMVGNSLTV